jgi:hypothetical protein
MFEGHPYEYLATYTETDGRKAYRMRRTDVTGPISAVEVRQNLDGSAWLVWDNGCLHRSILVIDKLTGKFVEAHKCGRPLEGKTYCWFCSCG